MGEGWIGEGGVRGGIESELAAQTLVGGGLGVAEIGGRGVLVLVEDSE